MQQNNDINNIQVLEEKLLKYNTKDDEYTKIYNKIYHLKNKDILNRKKRIKRINKKIKPLNYNYLYFSGLITLSISSFIYFYYLKDYKIIENMIYKFNKKNV